MVRTRARTCDQENRSPHVCHSINYTSGPDPAHFHSFLRPTSWSEFCIFYTYRLRTGLLKSYGKVTCGTPETPLINSSSRPRDSKTQMQIENHPMATWCLSKAYMPGYGYNVWVIVLPSSHAHPLRYRYICNELAHSAWVQRISPSQGERSGSRRSMWPHYIGTLTYVSD